MIRTLYGHTFVALTPDGLRIVSGYGSQTLRVWDLDSGQALTTLEGHKDSVGAVAVTPDGRRAVSASVDRTLRVWDLESGRTIRTLEGQYERSQHCGGDPGRPACRLGFG
jgi:WD40 repeat protein